MFADQAAYRVTKSLAVPHLEDTGALSEGGELI
jgi:hypothetical protein